MNANVQLAQCSLVCCVRSPSVIRCRIVGPGVQVLVVRMPANVPLLAPTIVVVRSYEIYVRLDVKIVLYELGYLSSELATSSG
jgi:hypothetical protein